jgi:hypothetical protein
MAIRAHLFANPLRHSPPADPVLQTDREPFASELTPDKHRGGALRGLVIAVAMSVPFWLALYLLLR